MENKEVRDSREERYLKLRRTVYYILGILETLLLFRFIFKILGANPTNTFVSLIYTISGAFLAPFLTIFRAARNPGIETASVLEPATLIAMAVYALIAFGIIKLIKISLIKNDKDI